MAKIGRNDPCPCDSGKKHKRCHEAAALAAGAQRVAEAKPLATPRRGIRPSSAVIAEDDLDDLPNSVIDLIAARRFDDALAVCERLTTEYPDVIDGVERSAMVHEARGDLPIALDFYRQALAYAEHPEQRSGFDDEGREYFREKIAQLEQRVGQSTAP